MCDSLIFTTMNIISKTWFLCLFLLLMDGVFGVDTDVKSVPVNEGDSVSLNTDVTEIQTDDHILWMFGPQETRIAEIYWQKNNLYDSNERFRDRLQMDSQTGSLTIRNIRTEHTGLYKLTIIRNTGTSYRRFNVTVYAPLPVPVISRGSKRSSVFNCSLQCSVVNVSHVTLSWYKGNSLLSSISVSDLSISLSLPLEVEYQDTNTYSCVVSNPISHHTTHLDTSELCKKTSDCPRSRLFYAAIPVVLALLAVVMCLLYWKHRRSRAEGNYFEPSAQVPETVQTTEVDYADTTLVQNTQNKKLNGTEETIYSEVKKH